MGKKKTQKKSNGRRTELRSTLRKASGGFTKKKLRRRTALEANESPRTPKISRQTENLTTKRVGAQSTKEVIVREPAAQKGSVFYQELNTTKKTWDGRKRGRKRKKTCLSKGKEVLSTKIPGRGRPLRTPNPVMRLRMVSQSRKDTSRHKMLHISSRAG